MKAVIIIVLAVALILLIVAVIGLWASNRSLRRRMEGLDEPELWLPRRERRAHARKLLKREDEEYMQQQLNQMISGSQPDLEKIRKGKSQ